MKTYLKNQKTLLISKLSFIFLLFILSSQPAISVDTTLVSNLTFKTKQVTQGQIIEYLISRGYSNISNVVPVPESNNWTANARNPQGFNVMVLVFTDGYSVTGHNEMWIK